MNSTLQDVALRHLQKMWTKKWQN